MLERISHLHNSLRAFYSLKPHENSFNTIGEQIVLGASLLGGAVIMWWGKVFERDGNSRAANILLWLLMVFLVVAAVW